MFQVKIKNFTGFPMKLSNGFLPTKFEDTIQYAYTL